MNTKLKITLILILLALAVLFLYRTTTTNSSVDKIPEGLGIDIGKQANIVNGEKLLSSLGSLESYDFFSEDLFVFANTAYPAYKNNQAELVGFEVLDDIDVKDNNINLRGRFGAVDNFISAKIVVLKNNRILTSITDEVTELNIDQFLPSNSKRNQFIGTLSVSTSTYTIDYDEINNGFTISLYPETETEIDKAYDEAEKIIINALGVSSLKYEYINIQRPSSSFGF